MNFIAVTILHYANVIDFSSDTTSLVIIRLEHYLQSIDADKQFLHAFSDI